MCRLTASDWCVSTSIVLASEPICLGDRLGVELCIAAIMAKGVRVQSLDSTSTLDRVQSTDDNRWT